MFAACIGSQSIAGPQPVICVRDTKDDPAQIRALFEQVDRMEVRKLLEANVHFYLAGRGFIPIDEFVLIANFRDGREDEAPLAVGAIRRLQFTGEGRQDAAYVVSTRRSAWFDRGSDANSSYTQMSDTWLLSFSGCKIDSIRETPELGYLVSGVGQ